MSSYHLWDVCSCFYTLVFFHDTVVLAPAECGGLGGPSGPLPSGGNIVFLSFCIFAFLPCLPMPLAVVWVNKWTFSPPPLSHLPSHLQLFVSLRYRKRHGGCGSFAVYAILFCLILSFLSFCLFVFLYSTVQYSMVQYSTVTGEEDGVRGWITPYSTPCVVSVWQVLLVWWQNVELTFCFKMLKITFFKTLFGALPKISDWIRKYVQIRHGFPFLKWCDTWQSVQWFEYLASFSGQESRREGGGHIGSSPLMLWIKYPTVLLVKESIPTKHTVSYSSCASNEETFSSVVSDSNDDRC